MEVFGTDSSGVKVWGPTGQVEVKAGSIEIGDNWILTDFHVGAKEILDVRQCFNDVSYIYAMGNNQSKCEVSMVFTIFLGRQSCIGKNNTDAIQSGLSSYSSGRISNNTSPQDITIGGSSFKGWLAGIDFGQLDPSKGTCIANVQFLIKLN